MNESEFVKFLNEFKQLVEEVKKLVRRVESIEKTVDLLHKDRALMESLDIRQGTFNDEMIHLKDRIGQLEKNTRADIADVHTKVENSMDEMKEVIEGKG
jgi:predicted  nucleic acid-binding Zn-ribbon protein